MAGQVNSGQQPVFFGTDPNGQARAFTNSPNGGVQPMLPFWMRPRGRQPTPTPQAQPQPFANTVLSGRGPAQPATETPPAAPAASPTSPLNEGAAGGFAAILRMLLGQ